MRNRRQLTICWGGLAFTKTPFDRGRRAAPVQPNRARALGRPASATCLARQHNMSRRLGRLLSGAEQVRCFAPAASRDSASNEQRPRACAAGWSLARALVQHACGIHRREHKGS